MIGLALELAGKLVSIGIEYATASAEKKKELLARSRADVEAYLMTVDGLYAEVAKNNADADAYAAALLAARPKQ